MNNKSEIIKNVIAEYLNKNNIKPHNITITIDFLDGEKTNKSETQSINWDTIISLKALHDIDAILEIYNLILSKNK